MIQTDNDKRRCWLCMRLEGDYAEKTGLEKHHVLFGQGRRKKAEADGLTVMLCKDHHTMVHKDDKIRKRLCSEAQAAWERAHLQQYGENVRKMWIQRYLKDYRRLTENGVDYWSN